MKDKKVTIKGILFDLDGTLLDTETLSDKSMYKSINGAPTPPDHRLPWELKQKILGLRGSDWAPIVLDYARQKWGLLDLPSVEQLCQSWSDNLNTYCAEVEACPGALELVEMFAKMELPMGIATSSYGSMVAKKRKKHERMFQHIQHVVCGDHPHVKNGKPAPDIYFEAARRLGVDPKECLVFEDALTGVRAGKAAGCHVVAVPDNRFDDKQLQAFRKEADVVLKDLWEFSGEMFGI